MQNQERTKDLRLRIYEVIFESDTAEGKFFDIALFLFIIISILAVMLESIAEINDQYHNILEATEWTVTVFFTVEYALRLYSVRKPLKYALSFYGIIDLLALLPSYLVFFFSGSQSFMVIRALRLLRVFRIFKLGNFMTQGNIILESVRQSRNKIAVFLYFIIILVLIIGSFMYVIEGDVNEGFDSIPSSIYWAIVTITTVGYGDITPITKAGKLMSAAVMILGYAVIAVPTGIVSASLINSGKKLNGQACPNCSKEGHDDDAVYCKYCGEVLNDIS